jgi:hypothetical protein
MRPGPEACCFEVSMQTVTTRLMPLARDIEVAEVGELLNRLGLKDALDAGPVPGWCPPDIGPRREPL